MNDGELTPKQARFAQEYLIDLNATQAAIRAGYSKNGAGQTAHNLLKNTEIAAAIQERRKELIEKVRVTQEMIVTELAALGFANMLDYIGIGEDGLPYPDLSNLTRRQAAALREVSSEMYFEQQEGNPIPVKRIRFRLVDKRAPLMNLAKLLGFEPSAKLDIEVGRTVMVEHTVEELRARARQIAEGIIVNGGEDG